MGLGNGQGWCGGRNQGTDTEDLTPITPAQMSREGIVMNTDCIHGFDSTTGKNTIIKLPDAPVLGKSYSLSPLPDGTWCWSENTAYLPLDTFVEGWSVYPWDMFYDMINIGTVHANLSMGSACQINGINFESYGISADKTLPAAGFQGTNIRLDKVTTTLNPLGIGSNNARTEITPWPGGSDPTLGADNDIMDLCQGSMKKNLLTTIENLIIGKKYYIIQCYWGYFSTKTFTKLSVYDSNNISIGHTHTFALDGPAVGLTSGLKRYGFTATESIIKILKLCPNRPGSYCNGIICMEMD